MRAYIPLSFSKINLPKLPLVLYKRKDIQISVRKLTETEKRYFNVDFFPTERHFISHCQYGVCIEASSEQDLYPISESLQFVLRCAIGEPAQFIVIETTQFGGVSQFVTKHDGLPIVSRKEDFLSAQGVFNMKGMLEVLIGAKLRQTDRIDALRVLLYAAMSQLGTFQVSCSLYVSILDTLFVPERGSIKYNLSKRVPAKYLPIYPFATESYLKEKYKNRSAIFHGTSERKFVQDDQKKLEELATKSIVDFIFDLDSFSEANLKKLCPKKRTGIWARVPLRGLPIRLWRHPPGH